MNTIDFEWDENKNAINKKKHKISFEETQTVFYDETALLIDCPEHSQEEERFIIMGLSQKANLLVVCHCYRASETVIRIISARKATKNESKYYYEWGEQNANRIWFQPSPAQSLRQKAEKANHYQYWYWHHKLFQISVWNLRHTLSDAYQSVPCWLRRQPKAAANLLALNHPKHQSRPLKDGFFLY